MPSPVVALAGCTNAGKSTLFNALTGTGIFAENQLFAMLDPTLRGVALPSGRRMILSDTVGFISELPTELVTVFRATLEEAAGADIILHVRDAAHPGAEGRPALDEQVEVGMPCPGARSPAPRPGWQAGSRPVAGVGA